LIDLSIYFSRINISAYSEFGLWNVWIDSQHCFSKSNIYVCNESIHYAI